MKSDRLVIFQKLPKILRVDIWKKKQKNSSQNRSDRLHSTDTRNAYGIFLTAQVFSLYIERIYLWLFFKIFFLYTFINSHTNSHVIHTQKPRKTQEVLSFLYLCVAEVNNVIHSLRLIDLLLRKMCFNIISSVQTVSKSGCVVCFNAFRVESVE